MFGKELTAVEVKDMNDAGICSNVEEEKYNAVRFIKWEDILQKTKTGNVKEVDTGCSGMQ